MDAIIIERSAYEELQTGFNSFINKMKAMANRGTDKKMGKWVDNSEVISSLHISLRTLQTLRDNGTLAYSQVERKITTSRRTLRRLCTRWTTGRRMPTGVSTTRRQDRVSSENRDSRVCNL